jgi:CRISPR-associated protein Csm4
MSFVQYLIRPLSAFHFGAGREDDPADLEDLPRSDTLVSAVLSVWPDAHPGVSAPDLARLAANPPFVLSSAMPALDHNGRVEPLLFVPPELLERNSADDPRGKHLRKTRFANVEAMRAILAREPLPSNALLVSGDGRLLDGDTPLKFSTAPNEKSKRQLEQMWSARLWRRESRPRLSTDRSTGRGGEGILFRYESTVFRSDLFLAVLAEFRDPSCRSTFETALRLLSEEGIGGGRSIGCGRFTVEAVSEAFAPNLGRGARMTLSLMHPARSEVEAGLLDPPASYTLVTRGGWAELAGAGVVRRRALNMLAEGSVVRDLNRKQYGDSVRVLPAGPAMPHPVYRSGCALTIPISWREQDDAAP